MAINSRPIVSSLTTDETFHKLVTIGEYLPKGKQYLLEWDKQRRAEIETEKRDIIDLVDSDDDDDDNDNDNDEEEEVNVPSFLNCLNTTESFPTNWSVASDDDGDGDHPSPSQEKGKDSSTAETTMTAGAAAAASKNTDDAVCQLERLSRKRKSVVFQSPSNNNNNIISNSISKSNSNSNSKQQWWKQEEKIRNLIPSNASGIVGVMGRRIDMGQLIDNDAGVYSMLRAWVEDDPDKTIRKSTATITTTATDIATATTTDIATSCRRKFLSEYAAMEIGNGDNNNNGTSSKTDGVTPTQNNLETTGGTVCGNASSSTSTSTPSTSDDPPPQVDLLKWLDTDPNCRRFIPYYPSQQQMREFVDHRRAKQAAKSARKKRLAITKEKLRLKGIAL